MSFLRRPLPRLVLWAVLIVGVATAAAVAGLSRWIIGGLVFGVWVIVAASERKLSGAWTMQAGARRRVPVDAGQGPAEPSVSKRPYVPAVESPAVSVLPPSVEPVHEGPPQESVRVRLPGRRRASTPAPAPRGTQWNVWTLEEVVRDNAPDNDELVYLTVSLREFANADGLLPPGFDPLVRESFGSLLSSAG